MLKQVGLAIAAFLMLAHVFLPAMPAQAASEPVKVGSAITADPKAVKEMQSNTVDLKKIPLIQNLLVNGTEVYYLGVRSGMHGFLLYKDGQVQVMYLPPDQQSVIFGSMYMIDGGNITTQQISDASNENTQLKALLTASAEQQKELERNMRAPFTQDKVVEEKQKVLPGGSVSLTPGERLFADFLSAAGVVVGQEGKPLVLMLVDPHCQFCKATWGELYEPLTKGQLRVKLIPIGAEGSENEKYAAKFLRSSDPLNTWNKFVNGDKSVLAGDPSVGDLAVVRATMAMVLNWKIQATPYIVYRGADGRVKVVQGKPDKIASILGDLKAQP